MRAKFMAGWSLSLPQAAWGARAASTPRRSSESGYALMLVFLMAAVIALTQNDLKRILAYSTISQLGYMFLSLGTGAYLFGIGMQNGNDALMAAGSVAFAAGLFHLMNHAFFKALLFLSAGSVIHYVHTEELKLMGGLRKHMKVTSTVMLIGSLSIAGIPILSGFWSKDMILSSVFNASASTTQWVFLLLWLMGVITAFLTAFYMFRLIFLTFFGGARMSHEVEHHVHESPRSMTVPLIVLACCSLGLLLAVALALLPGVAAAHSVAAASAPARARCRGWPPALRRASRCRARPGAAGPPRRPRRPAGAGAGRAGP